MIIIIFNINIVVEGKLGKKLKAMFHNDRLQYFNGFNMQIFANFWRTDWFYHNHDNSLFIHNQFVFQMIIPLF